MSLPRMTASDRRLKSVKGSISTITDLHAPIRLPPADGANLQHVYDDEARYIGLMRDGRADALWYDWVPERSISLSAREARKLGPKEAFAPEPIAVRSTGGTGVPQGPGTINISVFSHHPRHPGIHETYAALCEALQTGFKTIGMSTRVGSKPGSFCDGRYNLLLINPDGTTQKLVGTAQRWAIAQSGQAICLHHCVILSGGAVGDLCGRVEALYQHAGHPVHYNRQAHSGQTVNRADLVAAMDKPLQRFIDRAKGDRL